jgi:hypothetical protein
MDSGNVALMTCMTRVACIFVLPDIHMHCISDSQWTGYEAKHSYSYWVTTVAPLGLLGGVMG